MIKLIASDMDGTLLDDKMSISPENIAAIQEAQQQGIKFMVATGRAYSEAKPPLEKAGIKCGMITLNGAQIFDYDGHLTFNARIEKTTVLQILEILDRHNIYYEVSTNKGIYSEHQEKRIENFAAHIAHTTPKMNYKIAIAMASANLSLLNITYIKSMHELLEKEDIEVFKIIGFNINGQEYLAPARDEIMKLDDLTVTSSAQNNIEMNHIQAQKGIAVAHIAKQMNLEPSHVMTIGDNLNDLSMLEWANVSFAMENAEKIVKTKANYLTQSNLDSGVGKAILRAIQENL